MIEARPYDGFSFKLTRGLAISKVQIGTPVLLKEDNTASVTSFSTAFVALWDTGAEGTVVTPKVIRTAKLQSCGFGQMKGVDGVPRTRTAYDATIVIPTDPEYDFGAGQRPRSVTLHPTQLMELERDRQLGDVDILIGMDIMQRCDIAISADEHGVLWFSCCYPCRGRRIDIKSEIDKAVQDQERKRVRRSGNPRRRGGLA